MSRSDPNDALNSYDGLARLASTSLSPAFNPQPNQFQYSYNAANQVTQQVFSVRGTMGSHLHIRQLGLTPNGNYPMSRFNPNDVLRKNDALAPYNMTQTFRVNAVNELTNNTSAGTLTVMGTTTSTASSVTVNGNGAFLYGDSTFAADDLPLTTTSVTAIAHDAYGRTSTSTVNVNLSTDVTFQYDGNGNLTNDGLRNFVYDDENELIQVSVSNQWMSQFSYDGKMRRRIRKEFTWQGSWVQTNLVQYLYDGNIVIQERDINNLPTVTYTRGKDLSGRLEGAGGIGGLLARTSQQYAEGPLAGHAFYHSDGNGNITMLVDSSQGIVAKYLYDAFGNTLSASGLLANANVYRFSSKEWHQNSGLAYYLYRYYDPNLQRWPNKDPLGEIFGMIQEKSDDPNLYKFLYDDPVDFADLNGLGLISYFECARQIAKWEHTCLDGMPDCNCMKTDQGYIYCMQVRNGWIANCMKNAKQMMKTCLGATTSPPTSKPTR